MKIGLFTDNVPATVGGGFVLRDDIARAATALAGPHRFEIVVVPPPDEPPPPPPPPPKTGFRRNWDRLLRGPEPAPPPPPPGRSALERFADEVARRQFDLVWYNNFNPLYIGVPYIINIFDLQHRVQPFFPEVSNKGQFEHREESYTHATQRAAMVTVGSEEAKAQVCHFYGVAAENIHVLPFPTPQKAIDIATGRLAVAPTGDVRAKYAIVGDFLFYPAQFWSHKNHVNLLLALKQLHDQGRKLSLVLTGADHGNRSHVEAVAAKLGLSTFVHFCGFVPYEDILGFYRQSRALAYVSFFGPENLPPLEAMALECPLILSDIPGVRTLHGDGPVYVQPDDPASIAQGISFVLDHPEEIARRAKASRDIALANNTQAYLASFQALLDAFERKRRCWP